MLRNWYAVYTKPQKEKIVSSIFTKKGFECFCPLINTVKGKVNNKKPAFEPLFTSYVFVYLRESDISAVKSIQGVINVLYWKSKPAIIKSQEIDLIRNFTANYVNIKLLKSTVNMNENIRIKDDPSFSYSDNAVSVKYQTVKANLPSLGYTMIAERKIAEEETVYQESSLFRTFPRRINSFFFN
jgi:transcription antitermination factor NusG